MEAKLVELFRSVRIHLIASDTEILSKTVVKLLSKFLLNSVNVTEDKRHFYLELMNFGIDIKNIDLACLAATELKARSLIMVLESARNKSSQDKVAAFEIVKTQIRRINASKEKDQNLAHDKSILDQHVPLPTIKNLKAHEYGEKLIHYTYAHFYESSDDYEAALVKYEEVQSFSEDLPRVIMKHFLGSAHDIILKFCSTSDEIKSFWLKYLIVSGNPGEADRFCEQFDLEESHYFSTSQNMPSQSEDPDNYTGKSDKMNTPSNSSFKTCLNLGLTDHGLRILFANEAEVDLDCLSKLSCRLEKSMENAYRGWLHDINPILQDSTLRRVNTSLRRLEDGGIGTHVITTVILALSIFLSKIGSDTISLARHIKAIECMFKHLEGFLDSVAFNVSDSLVRATNGLTLTIKNNLDSLSDNEIVRESVRKLIETMASKCMIESRYKSAAMLYSHIDDNVNAIKSLMRTGEVDTVVNYALLVKNFTVNRITVNYLKHLKVDNKIIDNFLSKSQTVV